MMSILDVKRRGRRFRGGLRKKGMPARTDQVKHHIVVDDNFWALLENERKPEETNQETLRRILRDRTYQIQDLQKKVDALLEQQAINYNTIEINEPMRVIQ